MVKTMKNTKEQREAVINAARAEGIVDVALSSKEGVSLEILDFATQLMKEHGPRIYEDLAMHRKQAAQAHTE